MNAKKKRKFLSLDERMSVIRMYKVLRSYSKLGDLFGVSETAIRNTIINGHEVIDYYSKRLNSSNIEETDIKIPITPELKRSADKPLIPIYEIRSIQLLGVCVNEALKRMTQNVTMELIRTTAEALVDIMQLKNFKICRRWLNYFCTKYNVTISNEVEPENSKHELDLQEVLEFCKKKAVLRKPEEDIITILNISNIVQDQRNEDMFSLTTDNNVPRHLQISNEADVLKVLKAVEDFAVQSDNSEALTYIYCIQNHMQNK